MTAVVCARATERSSWRASSNSPSATAVSVTRDDEGAHQQRAVEQRDGCGRAAAGRIRSGSGASKASGSASATATIRLIQRIWTGCDREHRRTAAAGKTSTATAMISAWPTLVGSTKASALTRLS